MMTRLKSNLILFLIIMLFWILWNNTWDTTIWLYGGILALMILLIFGKSVHIFDGAKFTPIGIAFSFYYILIFIIALIKSNIDVLLRVLHPKLPINPGIVRVNTELKSPMARLILANSITLTPGTFVVDITEKHLYIHWIDVCCEGDPEKATQKISSQFENILKKIYE